MRERTVYAGSKILVERNNLSTDKRGYLPQFCKPCSEGLWLQLLKRVDFIDHVEVIWDGSRENVTIQLTSAGLGQFRPELSYPHIMSQLESSWTLNGALLSEFTSKTTIMLPYVNAAGSFAKFRTEED
jgi:hypothetical protein